jgi:hypothetical protein
METPGRGADAWTISMPGIQSNMDPLERFGDFLESTRRRSARQSPLEKAAVAATAVVTLVAVGGGLILLTDVPIGRLLPSLVATVLLVLVAKWSGLFTKWDNDRRGRLERRRAAGREDSG